MLPRQHRLSLKTEFSRLKKEGKIFQGRFFSLLAAQGQTAAPRFSLIVSKKISHKAVKRNKIRRLLSEAIYFWLSKIKISGDAVFLVKKSIIDQDFNSLKAEVAGVFRKAKLLE